MNIRWALTAGCLGALLCEFARAALPTVDTHIAPGQFDSPLAAVHGAGEVYLEVSRRSDREYVGGVLRDAGGAYRYTAGRAEAKADQVTFRVVLAPGYELVAFWHTHGRRGTARELFSEDDTRLVAAQGLPFYLITPSGRIRLLKPGRRHRRGARPSALLPSGAATGVIAGRIR